jgi:hypothetical protein
MRPLEISDLRADLRESWAQRIRDFALGVLELCPGGRHGVMSAEWDHDSEPAEQATQRIDAAVRSASHPDRSR